MSVYKRWSIILGVIAACGSSALGQFDATRILGTVDNDLPIPVATHVAARIDPAALQVIADHFQAVGAKPWFGMQAQGTLTYADAEGSPRNAELLIDGQDAFRLDISGPNGAVSTIIRGKHGISKGSDGAIHGMPSSTAQLGLIQFPMARRESFMNSPLSLIERGVLDVEGTTLHRVSMEFMPTKKVANAPATNVDPPQVIDFYFDPKSHLLLKTVSVVRLEGQAMQNFIRVITYSDYRETDKTLIPYRMDESLNGEPEWSLQLAQVQLTSKSNQNDFDF